MVGALGVIGRYIVEKLASLPDWEVVGLSRRKGEDRERVRYVSVDLLSRKPEVDDATHVFYAAFQASPGAAADYAKNIAANRDMLINAVTEIDKRSSRLDRVILVTGTKYYGSHLGPFPTPARETAPRSLQDNFYYRQEDLLLARHARGGWQWSASRPHAIVDGTRALAGLEIDPVR